MSKKLFSKARWKRYLKSRQQSELRKARGRKHGHHPRIGARIELVAKHRYHLISAPSVFSIVRNPDGVVPFLREIDFYASRKYNLQFDLSGVTEITSDAILTLVARVDRLAVYVRGNLPEDEEAKRALVESGFFDHLKRRSTEPLPSNVRRGAISRERTSKKVQADVARSLIRFGTEAVFGEEQRSRAAYTVMLESMSNTHNHAAGKYQSMLEKWWGTAFADPERGRVCFTFLDTGIGIFKSVRLKKLKALYKRLTFRSDAHILRDLLHGKIESSTGEAFRGKGLPKIYQLSQDGRISSLVIIANGVYANVSSGEYRMLGTEFLGTLLYWEIEKGESL